MKKLLFTIFFLSCFFLVAKKASAQTFSFSPATAAKKIGEEFIVTVSINVGTSKTQGADLKFTFDDDVLEITEVEKGGFFPKGGYNIQDGSAYLSYGNDQALVTGTGSGVFAKLTLKGKSGGAAKLAVVCTTQTTDSNIWDESTNDVIVCGSIDAPDYTITEDDGGAEATPAVTAAKTPTPTPPVSGITLPTVFGFGVGTALTVLGLTLLF